ncbi:MAG: GlsB/YeaQ/YmgE family stress response membrane protein [Solidesulfovibrio sp.]
MNGLLWFLLVGLIAGWLAGVLVKGGGFGVVGDIAVGIIGAVIGGFLFSAVGIGVGGFLGSIIVATVGAVILIFLLRLIRRV